MYSILHCLAYGKQVRKIIFPFPTPSSVLLSSVQALRCPSQRHPVGAGLHLAPAQLGCPALRAYWNPLLLRSWEAWCQHLRLSLPRYAQRLCHLCTSLSQNICQASDDYICPGASSLPGPLTSSDTSSLFPLGNDCVCLPEARRVDLHCLQKLHTHIRACIYIYMKVERGGCVGRAKVLK